MDCGDYYREYKGSMQLVPELRSTCSINFSMPDLRAFSTVLQQAIGAFQNPGLVVPAFAEKYVQVLISANPKP